MRLKLTKDEAARYQALGIQAEIARLQALIGTRETRAKSVRGPYKKTRKPMSKTARKRIAAGIVRHWKAKRAEDGNGNGNGHEHASVKPVTRKKLHWTQRPTYKAKMLARIATMTKARQKQRREAQA